MAEQPYILCICGTPSITSCNYCSNCGKDLNTLNISNISTSNHYTHPPYQLMQKNAQQPGPSTISPTLSRITEQSQKLKSFGKFRKEKGSQWKERVAGKTKEPATVQINIGMLMWNDKFNKLKPIRGKRMSLKVRPNETCSDILISANERWKDFYSECYNKDSQYVLTYENGTDAILIPGTSERFVLSKYKKEIDKDYKRIILYLCSMEDQSLSEKIQDYEEKSDAEFFQSPFAHTTRGDEEFNYNETSRELNLGIWSSPIDDISRIDEEHMVETTFPLALNSEKEEPVDKDVISISKEKISKSSESFYLVLRRGTSLPRILKLWQRQCLKTAPTHIIKVKYTGEDGIDTGALRNEFLADLVTSLGNNMFPFGTPLYSTMHIQNGDFCTCGEICAMSLAQGGPYPCFLAECAYDALHKELDLTEIMENHLTENENDILKSVRRDCSTFTDLILEHGYTGLIDETQIEDIIGSLKVSFVHRRTLCMREFGKGLDSYGLNTLISNSPESLMKYFLLQTQQTLVPDANYLFSILTPKYSDLGSNHLIIECNLMDYFQDFLNSLEDNEIKTQELSNFDNEVISDNSIPELSIPFVLGWLTGQRHKEQRGTIDVKVLFDHNCLTRSPDHLICYPRVSACSRTITLPVAHMNCAEQFKKVFTQALTFGYAFSCH